MQKQMQMLSPDPAPYEAHGYLLLCSIAAVAKNASDYFNYISEAPTESTNSSGDTEFYIPESVDNGESNSAPIKQFEGYLHTSHPPLSKLAPPTGSPVRERDVVPEPENDAELGLRSRSRKEPCEGNSETCDSSCTGCASPDNDVNLAEVPSRDTDTTEDRNTDPMLNREIENMVHTIPAVCRCASETITSNYTTTSMWHGLNSASERHEPVTGLWHCMDRSNTSMSEPVMPSDDVLAVSENKVTSSSLQPHNTSTGVYLDENETPKIPKSPKVFPVGSRRNKMILSPLEPLEGDTDRLFNIMQRTNPRELIALKSGFTVDLVNATTKEIYVRNVPLRMLRHFCGIAALDRFAPEINERPDMLKLPAEEAGKSGITRVIRFMRRACKAASVQPTGELRVPPSLAAGIETVRACRMFGLEADAVRIGDVMIDELMDKETWFMTDEHVELIWDGYHGSLRDTVFGDAIVWFVLTEVQNKSHPLAEEIRWMLDQEEYETLKVRVMSEVQRKKWRQEDRDRFLGRCHRERAKEVRKQEERTGQRTHYERHFVIPNAEQVAFRHDGNLPSMPWDDVRAGADTPCPRSPSPW